MRKSKLTDHKFKKGILYTPFNAGLGEQLSLSSWALERLPEYIWIALILNKYGRKEGINLVGLIIKDLSMIDKGVCTPSLSQILSFDEREKRVFFEAVCKRISSSTLSPLTVIFRLDKYLLFNEYFADIQTSVKEKITILRKVISNNLNHQSNSATDIRFLVIWFSIYAEKLKFADESNMVNTLIEYPGISHDDPRMRMHRPSIRAAEIGLLINEDRADLSEVFWKRVGLLTGCSTFIINYHDKGIGTMAYIDDVVNTIEYLIAHNKHKMILDEKFSVCLGIATYAIKIYREVLDNNLGNGILGRCALRTIVEAYINLKYMIQKEQDTPNIWHAFKEYGIGKYKYVVLKSREIDGDLSQHHFELPVLEAILNEEKIEEFTDMDTRHFDNNNVRSKFQLIGEIELYDLYYEYDTNYTHGFWGAIRESSMLSCNNPAHRYHSVPDIGFAQKLKSVEYDCEFVLKKLMMLLSSQYEFPSFYLSKYGN